jgi:hypothetical protein
MKTIPMSALAPLAAAVLVFAPAVASTCPFCTEQRGPTFVEDFSKAEIVVVGTFVSANKGRISESSTEFAIDDIIKDAPEHPIKGKKTLTLPRYLSPSKEKFMIFCDVYKGELDPYRAIPLASETTMVKYLQGAMTVEARPAGEKLRYYFDFLNSPETEIGLDAYRQYAKADYKDYAEMAKKLPADTLASWMRDPKTPSFRLGLYASLLGHCGKAEHAAQLRKLIDDPETRRGGSIDGMMAGLVMIDPSNWDYVAKLMLDPKQEFQLRYSAFRTARFFWDVRTDLVPKSALDKSVSELTLDRDMSDFAIDELRRWQRWEHTKDILGLFDKKTHNLSVIKRAILRFALQSPDDAAKTFVAQQRSRDAVWVNDTEELLKAETGAR